jgi:hypothetical protein
LGDRGGQRGISGLRRVEGEKGSGAKRIAHDRTQKYRSRWVVRCMGQKGVGNCRGGLRGTKYWGGWLGADSAEGCVKWQRRVAEGGGGKRGGEDGCEQRRGKMQRKVEEKGGGGRRMGKGTEWGGGGVVGV